MGSGGPRGLQILVSGTFGVRGGFDSHAFPPIFTLLWTVMLLFAPGHARAQAAADSASATPRVEVVGGEPARPEAPVARGRKSKPEPGSKAAKADTVRRLPWHEQPRFVMARSLVIPGWGQLHNGAWIKAIAVAGGEAYLGAKILEDQRELDRLLGALDAARAGFDQEREAELVNEYNARLDQRLRRQWFFGAALAYALIDAYVDANFRGFDVEFQNDPALPAGAPPVPTGGSDGPGMRLFYRWHF